MHPEIYDEPKRVAKAASYTTYSDIAPLAELDMDTPSHRDEIGQLLGEISKYEHSQRRPMLSAVVIHRDNNMPGMGFFKLARELGAYTGSDDLKFYLDELKRVHQHWGDVAT